MVWSTILIISTILTTYTCSAFSTIRLTKTPATTTSYWGLVTNQKFPFTISSTKLFASKKRKRRRKTIKENDSSSSSSVQNENTVGSSFEVQAIDDNGGISLKDIDDLPDFDLNEEAELQQKEQLMSSTSTTATTSSTKTSSSIPKQDLSSFNTNDPQILEAMKATKGLNKASTGTSSTKDLLRSRNRELEQKFVVNDLTQDLPTNLNDLRNRNANGNTVGGVKMGKKAARAAARKAAAIEAKESEEEQGGLLSNISFLQDENGETKSPIKLLEEGTWACIYVLVAWEVFINTPFFQRAGPMAPVVFTTPDTMLLM